MIHRKKGVGSLSLYRSAVFNLSLLILYPVAGVRRCASGVLPSSEIFGLSG